MKRTIISTMCIVAALVLASSCNKIEEISDPGDITNTEEDLGRTIINGVVESIDTKAELSYGYDVLWNTGDKIYVTTGTKDDTFTLSAGQGTTKGQFTEDNNKGITGNIEAFYPASLKTDEGYVWPATQETNNQVAPMYAKQTITGAEGETVNFSSLGAMLQIVFSTPQTNIILKSIEIKDGSKTMSGTFEVSEGQANIIATDKAGITLDFKEGIAVGSAAKYFNIAIPAGEYKDLTLTFTTIDGRTCVMKSSSLPCVDRNVVGRITLTGTFSVTADKVQLWENGPYWANINIGAVNPEDFGLYFSWGNTTGYALEGTSFSYPFDSGAYSNTRGYELQSDIRTATYDAAQMSWGGGWRIPSKSEFEDLVSKCDMHYYDGINNKYNESSVKGYEFVGKDTFSNNSIFLPQGGWGNYSMIGLLEYGWYWTSSYSNSLSAYYFEFDPYSGAILRTFRYDGLPIRPVTD